MKALQNTSSPKQQIKWAIIIFLNLFFIRSTPCLAQKKTNFLLGKWIQIEYHGSDGFKDLVTTIKNGQVYVFEKNNVLRAGDSDKGTYQLKGDSLHIMLPTREAFYSVYYENATPNRLVLNLKNKDYHLICDEGCSLVFKKK